MAAVSDNEYLCNMFTGVSLDLDQHDGSELAAPRNEGAHEIFFDIARGR